MGVFAARFGAAGALPGVRTLVKRIGLALLFLVLFCSLFKGKKRRKKRKGGEEKKQQKAGRKGALVARQRET